MSQVPREWTAFGDVRIKGHEKRMPSDPEEFLNQLRGYDMLDIKFLRPDDVRVGADIYKDSEVPQDERPTELLCQIDTIYKLPAMTELCGCCHDQTNDRWYHIKLSVNRHDANHMTEIALTTSGKVDDFGVSLEAVKAAMDAAFAEFCANFSAKK